jgi:hypothetical protein
MGSDELADQLGSRVLFVPWSAESVTTAAELAQELRNETGTRGMVVVDQLTGKPEELTAWPHRTLRSLSTRVEPTDVAAVILPSYELLVGVRLPVDGFAVIAEYEGDPLSGWAEFVGATNVNTQETMTITVDDAIQAALDELVDAGYKGWLEDRGQRRARAAAAELRSLGLTTAQILGYVISGPTAGTYSRLHRFSATNITTLRTLLS